MKAFRIGLVAASLVAVGLVAAPMRPVQATGATTCAVNGYVVKTPTHLANATSGNGVFGTMQIGNVPVPSRFVCSGTINGSGTATGSFEWCPQTTENHHAAGAGSTFDCGHLDPNETIADDGTVTSDEALWPGANPVNVHIVAQATITSDINNPLTNALTGTPYGSCSVKLIGHANALGAQLYETLTCGADTFKGVVAASSIPIVGPAGDLFTPSAGTPPQTCATFDGGNQPDCFRAVIFNGNQTASNPWPAPLPS